MKYCKLGKTDISISRVTHGCMELGGGRWKTLDKESNSALLKTALENGITTFDTAEGYGAGASELIVGEALKDRRKDCVIATKVLPDNLRAADVRKAAEGSLKRLQTDYIDLLYVHWPNAGIPISETLGEFIKLKEEGKIRAIGVSNFSLEQLKEAMEITHIDALQPEYNLLQRKIEDGLLSYCADNQISVLSYNSIAKGILSGVFHFNGVKLDAEDFRNEKPLFFPENLETEKPLMNSLKAVAQVHNGTISQIAAAWVLAQRGMSSAIIGTQNPRHFVENIHSVDIELTQEEIDVLNKTSSEVIGKLIGV
ncbi:oxidoreductase [Lachnospiraceae bacterium]|nr:oxidoreductase [Lachnospiraceae bacterium]